MIRYLVLQWPSRFLACLWLQKHAVEVCSAQGFRWWQGALRHFNLLDMEKEKAKAGRNKTSDIFLIVHWLWSQTQWFVLMYMMWWLTIWQLKAYVYNLWPLTIFLDESRHPQLQRKTKDIGPSLQVSPLAFTHLEEMGCSVWGFGIQISLKHFFLNTKFRLGSKLPIRIVGPIHMTVGLQGLNLNAAQFRICLWWTCWIWVLWRVNDFGFPIHKQTLLLHESQLFCQKNLCFPTETEHLKLWIFVLSNCRTHSRTPWIAGCASRVWQSGGKSGWVQDAGAAELGLLKELKIIGASCR